MHTPQNIRNLHNYAWKTLIMQKMLSEFDGTMWFDSSVKFTGNQTNVLIELMSRHNTGAVFYVSTTGHSIITATHPTTGAPDENIVQNRLNIALLNVF